MRIIEKPFECGPEEGCDEVLVLFPEGAELGDTQVFLVEAPAGVLRFPAWSCGVGVLDLDEPVAPAGWQGRCLKVDAIDAEAVEFLERGQLAGDSFDQVGEARSFVVVVGDGEDVDFGGHGRCGRQLVLAEGAEDGLGADDDYFPPSDDLAGSADRVLELIASHQIASWRTA